MVFVFERIRLYLTSICPRPIDLLVSFDASVRDRHGRSRCPHSYFGIRLSRATRSPPGLTSAAMTWLCADEEQLARGAAALAAAEDDAERALEAAAAALGLAPSWHELAAEPGAPLALLRLAPASPPLVFAGASRAAAAAEALAYLRLSMAFKAEV